MGLWPRLRVWFVADFQRACPTSSVRRALLSSVGFVCLNVQKFCNLPTQAINYNRCGCCTTMFLTFLTERSGDQESRNHWYSDIWISFAEHFVVPVFHFISAGMYFLFVVQQLPEFATVLYLYNTENNAVSIPIIIGIQTNHLLLYGIFNNNTTIVRLDKYQMKV